MYHKTFSDALNWYVMLCVIYLHARIIKLFKINFISLRLSPGLCFIAITFYDHRVFLALILSFCIFLLLISTVCIMRNGNEIEFAEFFFSMGIERKFRI